MRTRLIVFPAMLLALAGCSGSIGLFNISPGETFTATASSENSGAATTAPRPANNTTSTVDRSVSLADIGGGTFCSSDAASKRQKGWGRIGGNPYRHPGANHGLAYALHNFDAPQAVKRKWRAAVQKGPGSEASLTRGEYICEMMYSTGKSSDDGFWHHVWSNIKTDWNGVESTPATVYSVEYAGYTWELIRPHACDNWSWRAVKANSTPTPAPEPVAEVVPTMGETEHFKLRIRPWEWDSIPEDIQDRITAVTQYEGDETYWESVGAVSRDIAPKLVDSWENGGATTVTRAITATVWFDGASHEMDGVRVSAEQGDHVRSPELVYWEQILPRSAVSAHDDPRFAAVVHPPAECKVVYPMVHPGFRKRILETKTKAEAGENELHQELKLKRDEEGMNLNFILDCPN